MDLLSKKDSKKISLLQFLEEGEKNTEEVLQFLDVSLNTLNQWISDINSLISPSYIIKEQQDISLHFSKQESFNSSIAAIAKSSLEYLLLEEIFFRKYFSYLELADVLFVSESTLRRLIIELNKKLFYFDISIQSRPLRIIGNEKNIRIIFITIFKEKYGVSAPPFNEEDIKIIEHFYQLGCRLTNRTITLQDKYNFTLFSLVALVREMNGYNKKEITNEKTIEKITNYIYKKALIIPFNPLRYRSNQFSNELLINTFSVFLSENSLNFFPFKNRKQVQKKLAHIKEFIGKIEYVMGLNITPMQKKKMSIYVYEMLYDLLRIPLSLPHSIDDYSLFIKNASPVEKKISCVIHNIFLNHFPEQDADYFKLVFFSLYTRNESIISQFMKQIQPISIAIAVDFDPFFGDYVKDKIVNITPKKIIVQNINTEEKLLDFQKNKYDLTITNYLTPIISHSENMIKISNYLSKADIEDISNSIDVCYQTKLDDLLKKIKERSELLNEEIVL